MGDPNLLAAMRAVLGAITAAPASEAFRQPFEYDEAKYGRTVGRKTDLASVSKRLEAGEFTSAATFTAAVKEVFVNSIRFNSTLKAYDTPFRKKAEECLTAIEVLVSQSAVLSSDYASTEGKPFLPWVAAFPEARMARKALDELIRVTKHGIGPDLKPAKLQQADGFIYPAASYYAPGELEAKGYFNYVARPLCFGDVFSALFSGSYPDIASFVADVRTVFTNALAYPMSEASVRSDAEKLLADFDGILGKVLQAGAGAEGKGGPKKGGGVGGGRPSFGAALRAPAVVLPLMPNELPPGGPLPPAFVAACKDVLLRTAKAKWTSPGGLKVVLGPIFETDAGALCATVAGYRSLVPNPVDIPKIVGKLESVPASSYDSPASFAADVLLMLDNCKRFNNTPGSIGFVQQADQFWAQFGTFWGERLAAFPLPTQPAAYPRPGIVVADGNPGAVDGLLPLPEYAPPPPPVLAPPPPPIASAPLPQPTPAVLKVAPSGAPKISLKLRIGGASASAAPAAAVSATPGDVPQTSSASPTGAPAASPSVQYQPQQQYQQQPAVHAPQPAPAEPPRAARRRAGFRRSDGSGADDAIVVDDDDAAPTATAADAAAEPVPTLTLAAIALAENKALQAQVVDGMLQRVVKHPFARGYFSLGAFDEANPRLQAYLRMQAHIPALRAARPSAANIRTWVPFLHYGFALIQMRKFKDDLYPSFGDLYDDVRSLLVRAVTVHEHPAWGMVVDEPALATWAADMAVSARRLSEYWDDIVLEHFGLTTNLSPQVEPRRAARDEAIRPSPVLPSTVPHLLKVIRETARSKEARMFRKPPHEAETFPLSLLTDEYYLRIGNAPIDLGTMERKVDEGLYGTHGDVLADFERLVSNAEAAFGDAPPGSEGAKVVTAARATAHKWWYHWSNLSIEIADRLLVEGIHGQKASALAAEREKREDEARVEAGRVEEARQLRRAHATASGLVEKLLGCVRSHAYATMDGTWDMLSLPAAAAVSAAIAGGGSAGPVPATHAQRVRYYAEQSAASRERRDAMLRATSGASAGDLAARAQRVALEQADQLGLLRPLDSQPPSFSSASAPLMDVESCGAAAGGPPGARASSSDSSSSAAAASASALRFSEADWAAAGAAGGVDVGLDVEMGDGPGATASGAVPAGATSSLPATARPGPAAKAAAAGVSNRWGDVGLASIALPDDAGVGALAQPLAGAQAPDAPVSAGKSGQWLAAEDTTLHAPAGPVPHAPKVHRMALSGHGANARAGAACKRPRVALGMLLED